MGQNCQGDLLMVFGRAFVRVSMQRDVYHSSYICYDTSNE